MTRDFKYSYEIVDDVFKIKFIGSLSEGSRLKGLEEIVSDKDIPVEIIMTELTQMNSTGIKAWIDFLAHLKESLPVSLVDISTQVVENMNLIHYLAKRCDVISFRAPYVCEDCGHFEEVLLESKTCLESGEPKVPVVACPKCENPEMELDELEDQYFNFLTP